MIEVGKYNTEKVVLELASRLLTKDRSNVWWEEGEVKEIGKLFLDCKSGKGTMECSLGLADSYFHGCFCRFFGDFHAGYLKMQFP